MSIKSIETEKFLNLSKIFWTEKEFAENVFFSENWVNKEQLDLMLKNNSIEFFVYWEESVIGVVRVDVEKMFDVEVKKKNESFVWVLDKFYKINKFSGT